MILTARSSCGEPQTHKMLFGIWVSLLYRSFGPLRLASARWDPRQQDFMEQASKIVRISERLEGSKDVKGRNGKEMGRKGFHKKGSAFVQGSYHGHVQRPGFCHPRHGSPRVGQVMCGSTGDKMQEGSVVQLVEP